MAGVQIALGIIESRRFKQPGSYRDAMGEISDGALNTLIAELRDVDGRGNYPLKVVTGEFHGDDWPIGHYGLSYRSPASPIERPIELDVHVTTDRVHCSELRGDALDDAECVVTVRNHLPAIIAALEELLGVRLASRLTR